MALFKRPDVIESLDDLLDRERRAILQGDLDGLIRLGPEKERLLGQLSGISADMSRIVRLRQKADRNQDLLAAVARGIRSASQRVMQAQKPAAAFKAYDQGGRSTKIGANCPDLAKRA